MRILARITTLLLGTFILSACGPSAESEVETAVAQLEKKLQQPADNQQNNPAPPASVLEASGLVANDERADLILLLPDTRIAMQAFQRDGLAMLVGRQAGYRLTTHDAAGSAAQQVEQFRQAIAAKPAAIIVSPIDPPALAALIVEAKTAGITVIGLDQRMLKDGCTSIVYSDQELVGRIAAQTVLEALKRKADEEGSTEVTGRVVELRGVEDSLSTNKIAEGFSEGLRAQPGVIIVHDAPVGWSAEQATKCIDEAFRLQKNFDVIYAHSDAIAMGAAKATETAGQRENILIVGTEGLVGQKRGIELVRQGELDATIVQPALVDLALQIIVKLRSDKTFQPKAAYEIKPVAVVPKNVEQSLRTGTYKMPKL